MLPQLKRAQIKKKKKKITSFLSHSLNANFPKPSSGVFQNKSLANQWLCTSSSSILIFCKLFIVISLHALLEELSDFLTYFYNL